MTEQEFVTLAEALKARLYRTAYLYLGSEACALDAVDEAIYLGLLHYKRLRQPEHFNTWLTRILINACNAERRRLGRWITAPAGSVAAMFAVFVLLVNLVTPFAMACSGIPILKGLTATVAFSPQPEGGH